MNRKPLLTIPIQYRNRNFHFAIYFPRWWKPFTVADRNAFVGSPHENFLSFRFRYKGKVYDPIFTICISNLRGKAWKRAFAGSPVKYLGQHNNLTYGYLLAEELPDAFLKPDKQSYDYRRYNRQIRIMKQLVKEAPIVLRSLHFIEESNVIISGCKN